MSDFYGMDGQPITLEEWGRSRENNEQVVARSDLPGGVWVSTVWLGLDHGFGMGPPLIFETMVFAGEDMTDLDCIRYATREQAEAGHEEAVTRWTGWTPGDPMPPDREASALTQFIEAMDRVTGDRPYTYEDSKNDQMVVMYPKDSPLAQEAPDE